MLTAIAFMFIGLILILAHAEGRWILTVSIVLSDFNSCFHMYIFLSRMEINLTKSLD